MHAEIPSADSSSDDAAERMLRSLPVAALPPGWRSAILNTLPLPPTVPAPVSSAGSRFLTRKFVSLMAGIWGLTAAFHFTTPPPSPAPRLPEGAPPPRSAPGYPRPFPPDTRPGDPWLAQVQNPYPTLLP